MRLLSPFEANAVQALRLALVTAFVGGVAAAIAFVVLNGNVEAVRTPLTLSSVAVAYLGWNALEAWLYKPTLPTQVFVFGQAASFEASTTFGFARAVAIAQIVTVTNVGGIVRPRADDSARTTVSTCVISISDGVS